eukprot:SAG22_NODE_7706_length_716_cov_0.824959_1_plen_208_part_01
MSVPGAAAAGTAGTPLQYLKWESRVEVAFWQGLANTKLTQMKLSEGPVPITGTYAAARSLSGGPAAGGPSPSAQLTVGGSSFSPGVAAGPGSVAAPGTLVVYNKLETFKAADKNAILTAAAEQIWDDARSGAAVEDPALLNRFVLVTHADLKTWKFYYWFCFPGLGIPAAADGAPTAPIRHAAEPQLAREAFGAAGLGAIAAAITAAH